MVENRNRIYKDDGKSPSLFEERQMTTSRISGFYNLTIDERHAKIADSLSSPEGTHLTPKELLPFIDGGLTPEAADHMIENVVGMHSLPLGIGLNFQVNGKDVLVPMAIEEPSVVAGASFTGVSCSTLMNGVPSTTASPALS